jgi:hypothetical protein
MSKTQQALSIFNKPVPIPPHIADAPCVGRNAGGEELVDIEIDMLGYPVKCTATRQDAARLEKMNRRKHELRAAVQTETIAASERYRKRPIPANRKTLLGAIERHLGSCESHERADLMWRAVLVQPSEIFWPIVINNWSSCDASYHVANVLLRLMRRHGARDRRKWMNAKQREIYDALPDRVEVWRGSDRKRVRSIAWSTSRKVAERFATGMRGGAFTNPVIAHAFIPKEHVFWVDEGDEQEIVLEPTRLRKLTVENFDKDLSGRATKRSRSRSSA